VPETGTASLPRQPPSLAVTDLPDASRLRAADRIALAAVLVGAAYYAGSQLGLVLRFPPTTTSVLWPPNAVLTVALLLSPPRRWPVFLLAALPAHLLVQLQTDWPLPMILALFATNCSEALLAAGGVRLLGDDPIRFDTLRRVAAFIVAAVLLAPFLSSFLDAAVVSTLRGEAYGTVWLTRFLSNALSALTLVPALVLLVSAAPTWIRNASWRRAGEAAALVVGLVVANVVLSQASGQLLIGSDTALALLLPFLLWAAVRFGPGGSSFALLMTTLLAIWASIRQVGPFGGGSPVVGVRELQIFITVLGIPLMCLAAMVEERRRTSEALEGRLRFEELLSRVSGAFVHLSSDQMDQAIVTWLDRVGQLFGVDRITLFLLADAAPVRPVGYSWAAPGVARVDAITTDAFPWTVDRLRGGDAYAFGSLEELPPEGERDRDAFVRRGVQSGVVLPLEAGGRILGGLAFVTVRHGHEWPEAAVQRLRLVAEVFASALARKQSEDALRASEVMKSAILASLSSRVAVLDREGRIIAVNQSWADAAADPDGHEAGAAVGANYLEMCHAAALRGLPQASDTLAGIEDVLQGSRTLFALEYPSAGSSPGRWFAMSVVPLSRPEGGAVVSYTDVSERKRAELEAELSRQELAHFTRVSTMGELTVSLAHELNQPLTGILSNAQAARRFLKATPPVLEEVHAILEDIIEDDRRAGEVIDRLRELLRKGKPDEVRLDLHVLIREVVRLLRSDAIIRNVAVTLDADSRPAIVRGDRVQLQQAVLNLLLNALEATEDGHEADRVVRIQARVTDVDTVHVSVCDAGSGLLPDAEKRIFEPFYTTKPSGMGMGLSITRSIVEAHGGTIWATNNADRGATFHFALPLAGAWSA
jgi:signal transduction histidine kinase/integral membrane sensor domain MASE1